ncbi:metallophosphoesterase family protein, partial [Eubacterium sp.]|uniref:metallophosphoesterase family protein n=1 Tax=Eubacterium sp. TaxID=142586 RepID=UPI003F0C725E
ILAFGIGVGCLYAFGDKIIIGKTEVKEFTTENEGFKVGIISDTQLPPTEEALKDNDLYVKHLRDALTALKNNNVDMILFAGDIGDLGTYFAFETYENTIDEVYGSNRPIIQTIMGNHDFWNKDAKTATNHIKAFKEVIGESPWTHYVVNGYHFIGASPNCGMMRRDYVLTTRWLEKELDAASKDSDGKPIFVTTHNQPKDTCYGSDEWGDSSLNELLEKYPNVVLFGGHSHYSVLDERTIWQGDYTVIQTQSLSYIELETGKENGTIPPNADQNPMGYIMEFSDDEIQLHRISFDGSEMGTERKADMLWTFDLPYENNGKFSFESRKANNTAPVITDTAGTATVNGENIELTFTAGTDDDFVHSYKVVIDGKDEKLFFSDYYNGIENMAKQVTLTLNNDNKQHKYEIYAVDSWGAESENCISIDAQ